MTRGGKRPGTGRPSIKGREIRLKLTNKQIKQLELNFNGTSVQEKIRDCIDYGINQINTPNNKQSNGITVVDLFSGAGGLSKGFMDGGYNVVLGVDHDDMALKTFKENHGTADTLKLDLFNHENLKYIVEFLEKRNIDLDVLVGGPPCQGYSLAGPRNVHDDRNGLYEAMVKLAKLTKPKIVVLENVPGLLTLYDGKGSQRILDDFTDLGYNITAKILYAPQFGIPQIRKRVFFVGLLDSDTSFKFPTPIVDKEDFVTCEQAISDLPSLSDNIGNDFVEYTTPPVTLYQQIMRKDSKGIFNHIGTNHAEKTIKLISMVPEGKNYKSLPEPYCYQFKYNEALTRYHSKKPSLTINTGHRSHFHYKWNRIPTVRESARLQSFPDDFIFYGNKTEQYRQVGNAVPPMLGKVLACQLSKYLIKEKGTRDEI